MTIPLANDHRFVTIVGPDGTTPASGSNPLPISLSATPGAANLATGQVTTSTGAATLVIARPTRRSVLVRNLDASINVYVGPATVSSANGMLLKPGESCPFTFTGLIQVIAASGAPVVGFADEYD